MAIKTTPDANIRGAAVPACLVAGLLLGWYALTATGPAATAADLSPVSNPYAKSDRVEFNRDVRPILADRCFACHGPDPNKRQADLRLDRPDAATGPLPLHPDKRAFVPGDPARSEGLRRILSDQATLVMPPAASHLRLTAAEKETVRKWIDQGGAYQEHWAFTKPQRPPLPPVADAGWPRNDIDHFVLANLEANGLHPSPEADPPTLIRRASLDLTGIPPTPAEVDAFVADRSPDAYEKVVDRLLASPRYGEQMAVPWLDAARYADSHGFQSDPERHMWRWRDWVINAYNANMPFDEFAVEQIAGDLLPNATTDQRVATGFARNGRFNDEGGIIEEEWRVEGVIDRTTTTSAVFLGLTAECCRCHDHKYDPVTQREFYALTAYFNSVNEKGASSTSQQDGGVNAAPVLKLPTDAQRERMATLTAKLAEAQKTLDEQSAAKAAAVAVVDPPGMVADLIPGEPATTRPSHGVVSGGDVGRFDRTDAFSYGAWVYRRGGGSPMSRMTSADGYRGYDLFMDGDRLAAHIIHRWPEDAIKVHTVAPLPAKRWRHVFVTYDGSGRAAGVSVYVNGRSVPVEVLNDTLSGPITNGSPLLVGGRDGSDPFDGDVADARVYGRALSPAEVAAVAEGPAVRRILAKADRDRSQDEARRLAAYAVATDPELSKVQADADATRQALMATEAAVGDTMVMEELPHPRDTFVLLRGEYDKHGDQVEPGTPAVLPPLPKDAPPNRLGFARWVASADNPLTSRVLVNRLWEKFFGVGLVKTSENLGVQADWPSNPQLLDWLATEIVALRWDQKALQREIVLSAAYRQSSAVTPELVERDPENRLIARGPRFRLSAETIRDQALAVSGLLVEHVGGPSVRPYAPANLWAGNLYGNLKEYYPSPGADLYRRGLYTFVKRTAPAPAMTTFDQPTREYCVIRRSRTDTPLQALDLLDDPTYVEAARVLAEHAMGQADPVGWMFKRATCREPTADERRILAAGFDRAVAKYEADPAAAAKLVAVGASKADPKLDVPKLAAYATTASVILNLDEMVTKQ